MHFSNVKSVTNSSGVGIWLYGCLHYPISKELETLEMGCDFDIDKENIPSITLILYLWL